MSTTVECENEATKVLARIYNKGKEDWKAIGTCKKYLANCLTNNYVKNEIIARGMLNCYYHGIENKELK